MNKQELVAACWQTYPGAFRAKARNECISAANKGKPYSKDPVGPPLLEKPGKLWTIKEPWGDRPTDTGGNVSRVLGAKTGGDTLRTMARGWKPPNVRRFQDIERKATIIGALRTLRDIGVQPYVNLDLSGLPVLKLKNDRSAQALLAITRHVAPRVGAIPPQTIQQAAELMRAEALRHQAGSAAWQARASALLGSSVAATEKRAKVEGHTITALAASKEALKVATAAAAPTVIGGIILGIAATGTEIGYWVTVAAQGRSKIENARAQEESQLYEQKYQQEITNRGLRLQRLALERDIAQEHEQAKQQGEAIAKAVTYTSVALSTGLVAFLSYKVIQQVRGR
jgi:hypothetical protein